MHFVDRQNFSDAPLAKLQEFNNNHKAAWASYNTARINGTTRPARPGSAWLDTEITTPLKKMFLKNCGYCGIHADTGRDAEVDHFFPTSADASANHVFDWENYVWSCPSCNGMKSNNHPFLNPCSADEMQHVYFHAKDGRYFLFGSAPNPVKERYDLTKGKSNLNLKNRCARRKLTSDNLQTQLKSIIRYNKLYLIESKAKGEYSADSLKRLQALKKERANLITLIEGGDYLFLIKSLIEKFKKNHPTFPYTFQELLDESAYLES